MMMYKKLLRLTCALGIFAAANIQAQTPTPAATKDTSWSQYGGFLVNFNQSTFYQWAPGGQSNLSFSTVANYTIKYEKAKNIWKTDFLGSYGTVRNFDIGATGKIEKFWRKSDDVLQINTKYSRKASEKWFYSANVNFLSQFDKGYAAPDFTAENYKSNLLAPAFITAALGFTYRPNPSFEAFVSPATGKITLVNDQKLADLGIAGVEKGKKSRSEFGASAVIQFNKSNLIKNVDVKTMLQLFNNYTDADKENRKNIDVTWNWNVIMKINKFLSASIIGQLVYDDNILVPRNVNITEQNGTLNYKYNYGKGIQLKNVLGIGLSYKFKK
jgi:hypothetical protein